MGIIDLANGLGCKFHCPRTKPTATCKTTLKSPVAHFPTPENSLSQTNLYSQVISLSFGASKEHGSKRLPKEKRHSAGNALNKASYSNSTNTKVVVETSAPTTLIEIQTSIFSNSAGLKCLQIDPRYSNLAALYECPFSPSLTNLLSSPLFHLISSILYFPTFYITEVAGAKIHSHLLV